MIASLALALTLSDFDDSAALLSLSKHLWAPVRQAPQNIPTDAEVVYPLMPRVQPAAGSKIALEQSIHSVSVTLAGKSAVYESLSLYKNTTDQEGSVSVILGYEAWRSGVGPEIKVETLWDGDALTAAAVMRVRYPEGAGSQLQGMTLTFPAPVKKQATHSLRLKFTLPVGKSGVDREERLVAYRVSDIKQTKPLEQFRVSVKYDGGTVFTPIGAKPDWGWQVGANGAYLKLDGRRSDRDAVLAFRYYPAGF